MAQSGEKMELELLPEELYGNIRRPSRFRKEEPERANPVTQGGVFEQLYHRNVFHMGALYALLCWVVIEIAPPLFKELHIASWVASTGGVVAALGFPLIMLFAWNKELTRWGWRAVGEVRYAESLNTQVRKQLTRAIVLVLAVGLVYLAISKIWLPAHESAQPSAPAAGETVPAGPSSTIAVLAFTDSSDAADQGYQAHGLAESLPSVLASLPQLGVTSTDSSLRFRSGAAEPMATGGALGVQYLIEGNVRRVEDRLQAAVQLVDARDGSRRWSETYERPIANSFQLRDDIVAGVARALAIPLGADAPHARRGVRNAEAYDLYLRARDAFGRGDRSSLDQAADLYKQALDLEPQSAPVETGLAELALAMVQRGYLDAPVGVERARQAADIAVSVDLRQAEAHRILAWIHTHYDLDWRAAAHELDLARAADPRDPLTMADQGALSLAAGQFDSAVRDLQAASARDPLNLDILLLLGQAQLWDGHLAPAQDALRRLLQLDPNFKSAHYHLGLALLAAGDPDGALAEMKREPDARHRLAGSAQVLQAMGRKAESDTAIAQLKPLAMTQWGSGLAAALASRNEPDAAFQWLERALAQKDPDLQRLRGNPSFQNISADPRFAEFLRRMNLPG